MKFSNVARCTGIKESKGEFEGKPFSSTTFHLIVDVAENGAGRSIGAVSRPFKFGDASEFDKWAHLKNAWPPGGLDCACDFDLVAGADNATKLVLLGIKPPLLALSVRLANHAPPRSMRGDWALFGALPPGV